MDNSPTADIAVTSGSLYLEHNLKHVPDYMVKVLELGLDNVIVSDREAVADYFLGKVK